jgi:hypothetical protein
VTLEYVFNRKAIGGQSCPYVPGNFAHHVFEFSCEEKATKIYFITMNQFS